MKKPNYTPGQSVEVEMHNPVTGLNEWKPGTIIAVIPAIDVPYRIEVQVGAYQLTGNAAAHPDCVRPSDRVEQATAKLMALTGRDQSPRVNKQSAAFKTALAAIQNPGVDQVCGKATGSGSYASSTSWATQVGFILTRAGISYHLHNVAPKGGKAGDRIRVNL